MAIDPARTLMDRMSAAHTDLNTFATVVSILEGGHLYGGNKSQNAASKIIAACKREQARLLLEYDEAAAGLRGLLRGGDAHV